MSIKTLAIRSVFSNWVSRACAIVITFFLTPFVLHSLGNESYGVWAILMSFTSYYALADMGVRAAATKYISQYVGIQDRKSTSKIIVTTLLVYLSIAACLSLIVLSIAWIFPFVIEFSQETILTVRYVILLTGGTVAITLFGQVFTAILHAHQRFDLPNLVAVASQLINAFGCVIVLRAGYGLMGMATVALAVAVLSQLSLAVIAIRLFRDITFSSHNFDRDMLKLVFRFARISFLTNTARRLTQYFGTIIIGVIYGPAAVTFYAIPESLSRHVQSLAKGVTSVIDPLASRLESQGQQKSLIKVVLLAPRFLLASSLSVAILLITHGKQFIGFWVGHEYAAESYPVLCVLAFALVARMTSDPLRATLRGMGRLRVLAMAALLEMAITLIVGPSLTYQFGLTGMAWAILFAQVFIGVIILPTHCCKVLDFPLGEFFRGVVCQPIYVALGSLAFAVTLVKFVPSTTFFIHVIQMGSIAMWAAMVTFLFCLERSQKLEVLRAISQKMTRNTGVEINNN